MDVDDPQESSGVGYASPTSKIGSKARILEEDTPPADRHSVPTANAQRTTSNAAVSSVYVGYVITFTDDYSRGSWAYAIR
ncbi:uncharacterized protein N7496_010653 [Penicillium cataractarum]|uniref:Uncharacterized protein n=1 Tax=Penicillium cataractarum TaxID=2100454 RepID=A0A9W9RR98_9EURO|nr:uncharacterized protein N7496_010653 [Penicillium cataractarum]KAJ5364940.1 hypothetical protein N7496_010653 [Penicillium cataractarum]